MPFPADLPTLRLCSILASLAFVAIFLMLWRGQRDQSHYAHWAASLILYCIALGGLDRVNRPYATPVDAFFLAVLAASNIPVATGTRIFAHERAWCWWMAAPPAVTVVGFLLPNILGAFGLDLPPESGRLTATLGLALGMGMFGLDVIRQARLAVPVGHGGTIAGAALCGYIPCYLFFIAGGAMGIATPDMLAVFALVSDQLLLILLNLGLLAMPTEAALALLRQAAWRDGLTGAYNRAWLAAQGEAMRKPATLLVQIDIDHFKSVNDRFGHAAGDEALVQLSCILSDAVHSLRSRAHGHVVRMGGDEFLVVLPEATFTLEKRLIETVRTAVRQITPFRWTISMGVAWVQPNDTTLAHAIDRADRNLYTAKFEGRDRVAA